jgi:hypothetical protein
MNQIIQMYRTMIQGLIICHSEIPKLSDRKMFQCNTNTELCIVTYREERYALPDFQLVDEEGLMESTALWPVPKMKEQQLMIRL